MRPLHAAALAAAALAVAPASASALNVYAAQSLNEAFPRVDGRPTYNFAGSDALARQIRAGAPADVFASANSSLPQALYREGRCTKPVTFATNVLVLITPPSNPGAIRTVYDLNRGARKTLVIGSSTVPIGIYTRQVLRRLGIMRSVLRRNTVSNAPNVGAVRAQVIGGADAGFVYVTDWLSERTRLRRVKLPRFAQPPVRYQMCAVKRSGADMAGARAYIRRVTSASGRSVLRSFGFGVPRR